MTIIHWVPGTACDFFLSLFVLHHAQEFGLRKAWTAGVRQRLSSQNREILEQVFSFSGVPLEWIGMLPAPHDARTALQEMEKIQSELRLPTLSLPANIPNEIVDLLSTIRARGSWSSEERTTIMARIGRAKTVSSHSVDTLLRTWLSLKEAGERYLEALNEYQAVYFSEEEARIRPILEVGLLHAQACAQDISPALLVENLSRGVRLEKPESLASLTLFPSWWVSPLVFLLQPGGGQALMAFDARSGGKTEGTAVEAPDALVKSLKALGDPTRLRILKYLAEEPLAPSELARRLRLRPPTVIHHLRILRFAGLVQVIVSEKMEKRYAARLEDLDSIGSTIKEYLNFDV